MDHGMLCHNIRMVVMLVVEVLLLLPAYETDFTGWW